jgi:hypothetical protein
MTGLCPVQVHVGTAERSSAAAESIVADFIHFESARSSENAPAPRNSSAAAMASASR